MVKNKISDKRKANFVTILSNNACRTTKEKLKNKQMFLYKLWPRVKANQQLKENLKFYRNKSKFIYKNEYFIMRNF